MGTQALIGLGSNLGDRQARLDAAVAALARTPEVEVRAVSSYHETAPVGGPGGQAAFLNAAAVLETSLEPEPLLDVLNIIENHAGRVRDVRWGERTLDLDLLLCDDRTIDTPRLCLPHPRMAVRRFVLAPLAEIAHAAIEPITGRTIAELLANLDRRPSYVALHGADVSFKTVVFRGIVAGLGAVGRAGDDLGDGHETRSRALDSGNWPAARWGDRWLVTDFCLPIDSRTEMRDRAVRPTFAVILGQEPALRAAMLDIPLLRLGSCDPEAVVAEILAACAATRTG